MRLTFVRVGADIKVKEPDFEAMARGKTVYLPPRFMTVNQALEQLIEVEEKRQEGAYTRDTLCVGMARLGQKDQKIAAGTMDELLQVDFGAPLHCLAIAGDVHCLEEEVRRPPMPTQSKAVADMRGVLLMSQMLQQFRVTK